MLRNNLKTVVLMGKINVLKVVKTHLNVFKEFNNEDKSGGNAHFFQLY